MSQILSKAQIDLLKLLNFYVIYLETPKYAYDCVPYITKYVGAYPGANKR